MIGCFVIELRIRCYEYESASLTPLNFTNSDVIIFLAIFPLLFLSSQESKMAGITSKIVAELEAAFPNLVILTPESSEYEENLLRWNVAAEKKAASSLDIFP